MHCETMLQIAAWNNNLEACVSIILMQCDITLSQALWNMTAKYLIKFAINCIDFQCYAMKCLLEAKNVKEMMSVGKITHYLIFKSINILLVSCTETFSDIIRPIFNSKKTENRVSCGSKKNTTISRSMFSFNLKHLIGNSKFKWSCMETSLKSYNYSPKSRRDVICVLSRCSELLNVHFFVMYRG